MDRLWKIIRHNQALVIGMILAIAAALWAYGCQSSVVSILNPTAKVTRQELQLEVDSLIERAKIRFAELDRQDKIKSTVFNTAINYAEHGTINPVAFLITLGNILGLSAVIDNRRKDVLIKTLKKNVPANKV